MPKFSKQLNKWHTICKNYLSSSGVLVPLECNSQSTPRYHLVTVCLLRKWRIKFKNSASNYCCCIQIELDKNPECPAKDCGTSEGQKQTLRGFSSHWRGNASLSLHLTVLTQQEILSNWHEQKWSVEFYPSEYYNFRYKNEKSEEIFLVGLGRGLKGKNGQKTLLQIKCIFST